MRAHYKKKIDLLPNSSKGLAGLRHLNGSSLGYTEPFRSDIKPIKLNTKPYRLRIIPIEFELNLYGFGSFIPNLFLSHGS
jgi:hypothetical protein